MISTRIVKFLTLKWGDKYGHEYVNRLYNNVKQTYSGPFEFWCITDNNKGLDPEIKTLDINSLPHHNSGGVFTVVKLDLFKHLPFKGPFVFMDLDVLILKDLKPYFDSFNFSEPRYIENYWAPRHRELDSYHRGDCFVNSSFLVWDDGQYDWLYDLYVENREIVDLKFLSLDKFVYYCALDNLKFHPKKVVYTYSFGAEYPDDLDPELLREDYYVVLFNTSHKRGIELHDAEGWARNLWINGRLPGVSG